MAIVLTQQRYGKDAIRLARVERDGDTHTVRDLRVRVALDGDFDEAYTTADNRSVLPTDTQKNTVYAFAKQYGIGEVEDFALQLAEHFVTSHGPARQAEVEVDEYQWTRLGSHSFQRAGETRCAHVRYAEGESADVVSGLRDLVLLNTTGSGFAGFAKDRYTTLAETDDRILATSVHARWGHAGTGIDWAVSYAEARNHLVAAFVDTYSPSVQRTLFTMAGRVLDNRPEITWVWLSLPNLHHVPVDLAPFGLANDNEVFAVTDGPYGHIEATVTRDERRIGAKRAGDQPAHAATGGDRARS